MKTQANVAPSQPQTQELVILGTASTETHGGPGIPNEEVGRRPMTGLSDR